jgi:hypothetical protein
LNSPGSAAKRRTFVDLTPLRLSPAFARLWFSALLTGLGIQDTIVAVRPIVPVLPFNIPDSRRPLNPMMPIGAHGDQTGPLGNQAGFNNTDVKGNPIAPIVNAIVNLG